MNNRVELITYMGDDNLHSLAAWASTFMEFGVDMPEDPKIRVDKLVNHILNNGKKKRKIEDLLAYLAENHHTSPFRFSSFVYGGTMDIVTHYQKLKHTVILEAENAESGRYKELMEDKFYLPQDWENISLTNNSCDSLTGIDVHRIFDLDIVNTDGVTWDRMLNAYTELGNKLYHQCLNDLTPILGKKRAKETSRYFKTLNSQLNSLNKFSFDGVMQFYYKRHDTNIAQNEIAFIADEMVRLIKELPNNPFKYSLKAFGL